MMIGRYIYLMLVYECQNKKNKTISFTFNKSLFTIKHYLNSEYKLSISQILSESIQPLQHKNKHTITQTNFHINQRYKQKYMQTC